MGIGFGCVLLVVLGGQREGSARVSEQHQEDAPPAASSESHPVVVLEGGARLEPQTVTRRGGAVILRFADGHLESYPEGAVDFGASRGLPPPAEGSSGQSPGLSGGARSLGDLAAAARIGLPDPNAAQLVDAPASAVAADGDADPRPRSPERVSAVQASGAGDPAPLRADIAALNAGLRELGTAMAEVQTDCSGYTRGRASCPRGFVASRRHTAACQDAVSRARSGISPLEQQYSALWSHARRNGLEPGEVRSALRQAGLDDLRGRLDAVRARLDALSE